MCGGTPKTPAPPPDYTAEKQQFASQQNAQNKAVADRYNTAASAFNLNLSGLSQDVGKAKSSIGNLGIRDSAGIDDAYNTFTQLKTRASSPFEVEVPTLQSASFSAPTGLGSQFQNPLGIGNVQIPAFQLGGSTEAPKTEKLRLNGLNSFSLDRPSFQSVVTSPYNSEMVSLSIPTLESPNLDLARSTMSDIDAGLAQLDALRKQRAAEQQRINDFANTYNLGLTDLNSRLGQMTIADQSGIGNLRAELARLEAQRGGFSTVLTEDYQSRLGQPSEQVGAISQRLSELEAQRKAEIDRINLQKSAIFASMDGARGRFAGAQNDLSALQQIDSEIDALARESRRFTSDLPVDFSAPLSEYQDLNADVEGRIARLMSEQAAQQQRAELDAAVQKQAAERKAAEDAAAAEAASKTAAATQARDLLMARLGTLGQRVTGLTMADLDAIKAADSELSAIEREARGISGVDTFDLYDARDQLDSQLASLYGNRQAEEARNAEARRAFASRAAELAFAPVAYEDAAALSQREQAIARARAEMAGFSSSLPFDFTYANDTLGQAEAALAEARAQRAAALNPFSAKAAELSSSVGALSLQDEIGRDALLRQISRSLSDLSAYRGEDADNLRRSFASAIDAAEGQRTQLANKRGDIEKRAKTFLSNLRDRRFFGDSDLDAAAAEVRALGQEGIDYGAGQAQDELDALAGLFSSERGRIANDRATVAQNAERERQQAMQMLQTNQLVNFFRQRRAQPVTASEYERLLSAGRATPSAFAMSVGV